MHDAKRGIKGIYNSPIRILAIIVLAIAFAETAEEFFIKSDNKLGADSAVDVLTMVIFLSPVLYLFVFKPLLIHIEKQKRTQEALKASQEQLRNLTLQVMVIQEQERKKVAMELHDDVGQAVNIIKLQVGCLRRKLPEVQAEARDDIDFIAGSLDGIIEKIRSLSRELSPSMIEDLGLSIAVKGMFTDFCSRYAIGGSVEISGKIDHLVSPRDRIFIYRIFQEALTNVGKHARARAVWVKISADNTHVHFSIHDDGIGFDIREVAAKNFSKQGLGLAIMRERARMIGGSLDIGSKKGEGSRISLSVPVEKRTNNERVPQGAGERR